MYIIDKRKAIVKNPYEIIAKEICAINISFTNWIPLVTILVCAICEICIRKIKKLNRLIKNTINDILNSQFISIENVTNIHA
ncbi:hypothetical protein J43TS3_23090 [Ornithinibacillus bavariensis]|uniref:Uncharacterized protein n=1 Tax=Ornithinibacillus bavariensis TaxID=545502 RepID=A0A919XA71_9BACI|nr:hypothetical protein J43TS3_23090 [Ornithinibacillus bavariensis]